MIPATRHRRPASRKYAAPLVALAALLAMPIVAGADQGRGGGKGPGKQAESETEDTTTTASVVVTTVSVPTDSSAPATTAAPVITTISTPPSTGGDAGVRRELAKQLAELIRKVEKSKLAAEVRDGLLTRLRTMRDAAQNGSMPGEADLRALVRDVGAALLRPSGDSSTSTSTNTAATSTAAGAPSTTPSGAGPTTTTTTTGKRIDPARLVRQLDEWTAKVNSSALPEADKATLLAAIERLRSLAASNPVSAAEIELVSKAVSGALERDGDDDDADEAESHSSSTTAPEPPAVTTPVTDDPAVRPKGKAAVDAAIQTVTNSPLPDGLKQQILGVLSQAKTIIDDPTLTKEQVGERLRELHRAEQQRRLDEAAAKLTLFSQKIALLAFQSGTLPGAVEVIVEVHDRLAQANELLAAGPTDIETIKTAWKLLHEARTALQQFLDSVTTTTTPTPTPTVAPPGP